MPAALKVESGTLKQRILLLPGDGSSFLIGRSPESNLILYGPNVAERQAFLVRDGEGHRLVPLSSKSAIRIGERVLRRARVLVDGDRIRIGQHTLIYNHSFDEHGMHARDEPVLSMYILWPDDDHDA